MLALYLVIVIAALALLGAAPLPMSMAAALGALVAMLLVVEVRRRLWVGCLVCSSRRNSKSRNDGTRTTTRTTNPTGLRGRSRYESTTRTYCRRIKSSAGKTAMPDLCSMGPIGE